MQIYFPNFLSRQGAIGFFDYLMASRDSPENPNIIFNSDLNLEDWVDKVGGNPSLQHQYIRNDKNLFSFFAFLLTNTNDQSGQLFQDLYVLWKLKNKNHGIFFEIGTGYPTGLNNTWNLESNFGWNGVCIEPNPYFHNIIRRERKSPLDTRAIYSKSDVHVTLLSPKEFPPATGLSENIELKAGSPPYNDYDKIVVKTVSLVDCLECHSIPKEFDYLSYDTTGHYDDISVLETALKIGYLPKIITIGHNYKSHRPMLHDMLKSYGYIREFDYLSKWDDWYYHNTIQQG